MSKDTMKDVVTVNGQYIKDLSFENPKSPEIFAEKNLNPKLDISIDINATKLQNNIYEVELQIGANAKKGDEQIFIVELIYAGIFTIKKMKESLVEEVLFINCPNVLFPFARRIVADITRDSGFRPIMLNPINFEILYKARKDQIKKSKKGDKK